MDVDCTTILQLNKCSAKIALKNLNVIGLAMNKVEFAMINLILVLLFFIFPAYGGIYGVSNEIEKAPPGGCYTSHENIGALEKGERKRLVGQCAVATCSGHDIEVVGCSTGYITCRNGKRAKQLPGDLMLEYPQCCGELLCPENV